MTPAISVIMPVFNRQATVARAVGSVLAQTLPGFELLVIDDASTDRTCSIISSIADARIQLLRQETNRGANAARNRGILSAKSDLICFLDSDDEFLRHKLKTVVDFFRSSPEIHALLDSYELVRTGAAGTSTVRRRNMVLAGSAEVERAVLQRRVYKATPSLSARRHAFVRAGMFDERLRRRQDMDMVLRLAATTTLATTDRILWRKHYGSDSISGDQSTFIASIVDICARHPHYIANRDYRIGASRDFARHILRQFAAGNLSQIPRDWRTFAGFAGHAKAADMFLSGLLENLRRSAGINR